MTRIFDPEIGRTTRWRKGQPSPNPGGRPRNTLLTDAYRAILARRVPGDKRRRTFAELIAAQVVAEAMDGSVRAAIELADRSEGKARQALEPEPPDPPSSQYELEGLSNEELYEKVIGVILEMEAAAEVAGIQDRLAAARAERAKGSAGVCRSLSLTEPGQYPLS
jgi:Family of unknown function (DUF5681)